MVKVIGNEIHIDYCSNHIPKQRRQKCINYHCFERCIGQVKSHHVSDWQNIAASNPLQLLAAAGL
jgi:hypothetical protein